MKLSDMNDLSPCVKTRTAEQGMPWYELMFVQRLRFIPVFQVRGKAFLFPNDRRSAASAYVYSGSLSPVNILREALEATVIHLVQILPLDIWARVFLVETQDRFVQDELSFWRITLVIDEEPAFHPLAKFHIQALLWSGHFSDSVDIRLDHLQLALGSVEIILIWHV